MDYLPVQNGVPVTLFNGQPEVEETTIALNVNYDHIITCIVAQNAYGGVPDYLELDDQDGNFLWGALLPAVTSEGPVTVTWVGELVCQSQTQLTLQDSLTAAVLSISAVRLAPSATNVFAS